MDRLRVLLGRDNLKKAVSLDGFFEEVGPTEWRARSGIYFWFCQGGEAEVSVEIECGMRAAGR